MTESGNDLAAPSILEMISLDRDFGSSCAERALLFAPLRNENIVMHSELGNMNHYYSLSIMQLLSRAIQRN